ncbi:MAG: transglycosylase SLT domain-containing protein [Acidobacteria bacterium]|nr:transglycosylase SLT domain-containing protein [Acidobacteriota bacterium]
MKQLLLAMLVVICPACRGTTVSTPAETAEPEAREQPEAPAPVRQISQEETGLLEQLDSEDPELSKRARARLGLLYEEQERWEDAASMLSRSAEEYERLRPFLLLHLADVLGRLDRNDEAIAALERVASEYKGIAAARSARLRLPAFYARAGMNDKALEASEQLMTIRLDEFTEAEVIRSADALARAGLYQRAQQIRERILVDHTRGRYTEKLYDQLVEQPGDASPLNRLDFDQSVALAERLQRANRLPEALDFISRIRKRFPDRARATELVWVEAQAMFRSREYTALQNIRIGEGQPRHIALERLQGHALWRLDRNSEFVAKMNHILSEHPGSSEVPPAQVLLGKYWLTNGNDPEKAAEYLRAAIDGGNPGPSGENLWTLTWIHITAGEFQKALEVMSSYLERYPTDSYATNSLFWSAKLHQKLGHEEQARESFDRLIRTFPYSYYAYRAREILDLPPPGSEIRSGYSFPEFTIAEIFGSNPQLQMVRELESIGLVDEATRQYRDAVGANPDDKILAYGLADRYERGGEPLQAIIILNRTFGDLIKHGGTNIPKRFWEILYPLHYWDEIQTAAESQDIDPYLMAAIIRQESGWDPSIVSNAGAAGLMQIMPAELSSLSREAGFDRPLTRDDLFDPLINLRVGAAEIAEKREAMNGNMMLAIASYNAGQSAVAAWLRQIPADDIDFFIDSIRYNETRRYVMAVTRNQYEYKRIYGDSQP